ncbi:MAG: ROK family protein [Elusimicrobiota bacterium]
MKKIKKIIAVDLGATKTAVALVNDKLQIEDRAQFATPRSREQALNEVKKQADLLDPDRKLAAGISICGLLSVDTGKLLVAPNLGWEDINTESLFEPLNRPFRILNDGSAAAWASYLKEKEENTTRLLSVTLGTGVGGGLVMDGRIITGGVELGHLKTNPQGPLCGCGARGCLETIAGGNYLPTRAKEWEGVEVKSCRGLFEMAESGDEKAIRVWRKMGSLFGYYLSGVVNLTGVQEIIMGGRIVRARKYFFDDLNRELQAGIMASGHRNCNLKVSEFTHNMSLIGAAATMLFPDKRD